MRAAHGLLLAALLVLAGCSGLPGTATDAPGTPVADTATDGAAGTEAEPNDAGTPAHTGTPARDDPAADELGWEAGYWATESLSVTNGDGLNESEREAVVARAMARVEAIRNREFRESVPVEIISRAEFRSESSPTLPASLRTFDNAKFEAMFFVGEDRSSIRVQRDNRGANVLGYYDPRNDTIKLVSDGGQPTLEGERTLGHELVHALQDQYHNLTAITAATRDESNAQLALIEGEARTVGLAYRDRCGVEWDCLSAPGSAPSLSEIHVGIYLLNFFPYSDGPGLIAHLRERGGWAAVAAAFEDPPASAEQAIYPEKYTGARDAPEPVALADAATDGWRRVRPESPVGGSRRADYGRIGQSGLSAMFAYTVFDRSGPGLVPPRSITTGDPSDPYNYDFPVTDGWEGDRLHVYANADAGTNETAYVWRLTWESAADAREFADGYRRLLGYWGGSPVDGRANVWTIPEDSTFGDAFRVTRDGDTVTIVNAPTVAELNAVRPS
ncbi:MAG: Hvo_1808 family surface protein [Halorientalis sp.]